MHTTSGHRTVVLRSASVVDQYHTDNKNNLENVGRRSWSKLWHGFRAGENTTLRTPCGLPSSFLTAWSNNVHPCEVSEKTSIFSCRWKSARADDGLMEVLHHVVWRQDPLVRVLFMLWDRPEGDEIGHKALELTKQMFDHQGDTRLNEESNRFCKQNTDFQTLTVSAAKHGISTHASRETFYSIEKLGARTGRIICEISTCFKVLAPSSA